MSSENRAGELAEKQAFMSKRGMPENDDVKTLMRSGFSGRDVAVIKSDEKLVFQTIKRSPKGMGDGRRLREIHGNYSETMAASTGSS